MVNVSPFDLRENFAPLGAGNDMDLSVIGALMGHKEARATQRYVHLADKPLRAPPEAIGGKSRRRSGAN